MIACILSSNPSESLTPDFEESAEQDFPPDDFGEDEPRDRLPMPGYGPALESLAASIMKVSRDCAPFLRDDATSAAVGRARTALTNAASALKYAVPVECEKCGGDGCRLCSDNGWLPRGHVTK